jgi:diguanylate cyclase (GGDEF)-like protein/PAS domain S-box-containing protein
MNFLRRGWSRLIQRRSASAKPSPDEAGSCAQERTSLSEQQLQRQMAPLPDSAAHHQAQFAVHESLQIEERIARLIEVAPGALFTLRRGPAGRLSMTWAAYKLLEIAGCWPEDVQEDISALTSLIRANDALAWHQAAAESAHTLRPWHSEFRLAHPIRGETWIEWRATPTREPDGGVIWHGFLHDISQRKGSEDDLRMAASVFETAREGILITDPTGLILRINPAFTHITGYELNDVKGRSPAVLSAGRNSKEFYTGMWATLQTQGTWSGEVVNQRKDGEIFTESLSICAVRDPLGNVVHYVGIFSDISQLLQHKQQLEFMAHHDTLTGLPNRILLTDRLSQAIAQSRRTGEVLAVLFLDLDGFKPVNDTHGHEAGDRALIEIGQRITRILRASDTVARIGGDEFVILLPGLANAPECEFSAERLLKAIAEPVDLGQQRVTLSASIGIALYPNHADDADSLLRRADEAMYSAKRTGRNQCVFFGGDARASSMLDAGMVHELRQALAQDQIEVYYQPIVDLVSGRVYKAEALVRWRHPLRGQVSPVEFIPIAEEAGLIHAIGNRVFHKSMQVVREWNRICPDGGLRNISVNRSPREFQGPDGADGWIAQLQAQQVSADMLSLEITEGLLLNDSPKVLAQLAQLRAVGMAMALDDFGTGFSSLSYLKKFDIDFIKIDRSFVLDIVDDPADRAIVESIIAMARRLGIKLIAEGVETQAQAALLAAAECDFVQGYLYARPMPEREFLTFVCATETTPVLVPALLAAAGKSCT